MGSHPHAITPNIDRLAKDVGRLHPPGSFFVTADRPVTLVVGEYEQNIRPMIRFGPSRTWHSERRGRNDRVHRQDHVMK